MKRNYGCLAFLLLSVFAQFCFSEQIESKPILVDEIEGKLCGDPWKSRLDNFAVSLYNEPNKHGYIIFYGISDEGENQQYLRFFKSYLLEARGISKNRLLILRGKNREKMRVELWIAQNGLEVKPNEQYKFDGYSTPMIFSKSGLANNGSYDDYEVGLEGDFCSGFRVLEFADILKENPNLSGYLVIYTKFGKGTKTADKGARYALRDLRKIKAPLERIKTVYGGNRQEAEIELWLVPEGHKLPKPTLEKRKAS